MGDSEDRLNDWARLVVRVRTELDLTQQELADLVKVSRATVSRWETGETINPSTATMRLFAQATKTDYEVVAKAVLGALQLRHAKDDDVIREVQAEPNVPEENKREIIDHIIKRRAEDEAALRRDVELLLRTGRVAS